MKAAGGGRGDGDHAARRVRILRSTTRVSGFTTATAGSVSACARVLALRISTFGAVRTRVVVTTSSTPADDLLLRLARALVLRRLLLLLEVRWFDFFCDFFFGLTVRLLSSIGIEPANDGCILTGGAASAASRYRENWPPRFRLFAGA
jgi:hypothetical protein